MTVKQYTTEIFKRKRGTKHVQIKHNNTDSDNNNQSINGY